MSSLCCINGYGCSCSNQNDKYSKGAPSNKITGVMPNIQNQGQAQLDVLLGGTKQPGSLHFVDTNSLFQQTPQASTQGYSPPQAKTTSFLQLPPQVSQSSQVSFLTLKTNHTSFQQLFQKSLSLQISLSPVKLSPHSSYHYKHHHRPFLKELSTISFSSSSSCI